MPTLCMKQHINLKINDDFTITDEEEKVIFKAHGEIVSWGTNISLKDAEGTEVARIKQTAGSTATGIVGVGQTYIISKGETEVGTIKKTNIPLAPTKTMEAKFGEEEAIMITSGVIALEYEGKQGEKQVFKVGKKVIALLDQYAMEFPDDVDSVSMACILVCIDQIYKEGMMTL